MPGGIFHIDARGRLLELTEEPYDSEELLQGLLADPAVIFQPEPMFLYNLYNIFVIQCYEKFNY